MSGSFILGYSGTETMKLFRVNANNSVVQEKETQVIEQTITNKNIVTDDQENAPTIKPYSQSAIK